MSTAKQLIIDNLSDISDDIQDEFEVMETYINCFVSRRASNLSLNMAGIQRTKYAKCFKRNVKKGQFLHEHNLV